MENSNSREYLDKITSAVIDHLRQTGPAPSVQMQDVPRKPFGGMTDEEEAELDDLDEDENKDTRMSEHQWDKKVENPAEFEPSDDDELARANGATRQSNNKRSFTDHGNDEGEDASGKKVRATSGAPREGDDTTGEAAPAEDAHDPNDDTIEDVAVADKNEDDAAAVTEQTEQDKPDEAPKAAVDDDGDVGMADSAPAEDTTTIKKEDAEPEAVTEAAAAAVPEQETADKPADEETTTAAVTEDTKTTEVATQENTEKPTETTKEKKEVDVSDAMDVDETEKDKPVEEKAEEKKETAES